MSQTIIPRRALLSVSDKKGLVELARGLARHDIEILSTGGSAATLREAGLEVTDVASVTGFPEIMDGRVKTLHPAIHGGILARRGVDDAVMDEHGIIGIDLVVINLYPFSATIARPECTYADAIENIDIGGPAMVRAAAKNHAHVAVVVDPQRYDELLERIDDDRLDFKFRQQLARDAYTHTSEYDTAVTNYLSAQLDDDSQQLPATLSVRATRANTLRYGENPHQAGALYTDGSADASTLAGSVQLQGKPLSWNNLNDSDAALACVRAFDDTACVIVKHANPCGVAVAADVAQAYQRAYACDPVSAFGGIIAFNREVDGATAQAMVEQQFIEVVIAPSYDDAARNALASKTNVRVLQCADADAASTPLDVRPISGGWLVQSADAAVIGAKDLNIVTDSAPSDAQLADLLMAWRVVKYVKSNAIVYARDNATIGIGAGQMSRVHSALIAGVKAEEGGFDIAGAVMASDAFFPFRDAIDAAATRGISAIIQPGGSMRDDEVIAAANEHNMAMVFTNVRHFKH